MTLLLSDRAIAEKLRQEMILEDANLFNLLFTPNIKMFGVKSMADISASRREVMAVKGK